MFRTLNGNGNFVAKQIEPVHANLVIECSQSRYAVSPQVASTEPFRTLLGGPRAVARGIWLTFVQLVDSSLDQRGNQRLQSETIKQYLASTE